MQLESQHLLQTCQKNAKLDTGPPDAIQVSRKELEHEHGLLMARVQRLRKLLGLPPLETGSQLRKAHR